MQKEKVKKIKSPDNEVIKNQIEAWECKFKENNDRGADMINFISCGKQWDAGVTSERRNANKESLTLNICKKELKKMKSQNAEIEFSLDIHPATKESQDNIEESNVFSMLMSNIILDGKIVDGLTDAFNKSCDFGYAFGEINYGKLSNDDLSLYPKYITHKDPRIGFWDLSACLSTKTDGQFCGIKRSLSLKELKRKFPDKKSFSSYEPKEKDNIVVDYWWREEVEADFYLLKGGVYKREDLLTFDDRNNLMTRDRISALRKLGELEYDAELVRKGKMDKIYFKRILNWFDIEPPKEFPTEDLPLIYHAAFTIWTPDYSSYTIPFGYELKGAQKLLNFLNSQIATQAKNSSSDKWIFEPQHVQTDQQQNNARNINKKEGGLTFGGDITRIRREKPAEVSMSLIQMVQTVKQVVDEINGAMIDASNAQQTVISKIALDKVTKNMKLLNDDNLREHIVFVNEVGKIMGQMIPKIITEERMMVIKKSDGSAETIIVNEEVCTGEIRNNIKDLRNKFNYEIKANSTEAAQEENMVRALQTAYQINPALLETTADIYFRNVGGKDSAELSRRASAKIDPALIKWSQGLMSDDDFRDSQKKAEMQAMQAKKQAAQDDPNYKAAVATAAAEHRKADALQKDSDTNRIKTLGDIINKEQLAEVKLAEVLLKADQGDAAHSVEVLKSSMALNDQMIDRMREVIGDNDMPLQGQDQEGGDNNNQNPDGGMPDAGTPNV